MDEYAWAFAIGAFAGFVNYLQRFSAPPAERPAWEWVVLMVKAFTGGFVGVLTGWLVATSIENKSYVYFAIAVAGYGGPLTLDAFWSAGREFLVSWSARAAQRPPDGGPKG